MLTQHKTLDELAEAVATALGDLDPAGQRLAIALYRLLAAGRPVAAADLAAAAGLGERQVAQTLGSWPAVFTDSQGRVTGFWGLAISELSPEHRYESGGQVLYAWCAWDTLFLPELLGAPAEIESRCPTSARRITLTVDGARVTSQDPAETVLSFLHREQPFDADTIRTFCHYVHFFANPDAAAEWTACREGTFMLSLADGSQIARLTNRARFPTILAD